MNEKTEVTMKYRDIIGIEKKRLIGASPILFRECIAFTPGHETAVFDVDAEIHPATTSVWFFPKYFQNSHYEAFTHKYQLIDEKWEIVEATEDMIDIRENLNFNPFCPFDKKYTGGHFATCQFPQNYEKHPIGCCKNTVIVEGRRLEMGVTE